MHEEIVLTAYNRRRTPMAQWTVGRDDSGVRLDKFLAVPERLGSRARAITALARGKIFLDGREATPADASARLAGGEVVRVWMDRPGSARRRMTLGDDRDLPIVYEDEHILVLNKPAGVLAVPLPPRRREGARSVFDDVRAYLDRRRRGRPHVVHRIDRDTSGLVVFAASAVAQARLKDQFARRAAERVYLAVVHGHLPPSGEWRDHIAWDARSLLQKPAEGRDPRAKEAVSRYRVVERLAAASLIEVTLVTGRQNQIRIQAMLHGHPLVGERRYLPTAASGERAIAFPRQALHAHRLAFAHPVEDRLLRFEAPLPADLAALIARLRRTR
jgi:23S rRNA pseudouridine1911/1915/1917 synthase